MAFADSPFRCNYIGTSYAISGFPPLGYESPPEYSSFQGFKPHFRVMPLTITDDNSESQSSSSSAPAIKSAGVKIMLRISDVSSPTQQLRQVTYIVNLTKMNSDESKYNGTQVLSGIFRSAVGNLTLNLHPSASKAAFGSNVTGQPSHPIIHANRDPILYPFYKTWLPEQTGMQYNTVINIDNVTFGTGRYHLRVDILGMAGEKEFFCMFDDKNMPRFDTYWTMYANSRTPAFQPVPELSTNAALIMAISFVGLLGWAKIISRHQKRR